MKIKHLVVIVLVAVVVAALPAQDATEFVPPWEPPVPGVDAGATLIATGFWADAIGLGLIAGAAPAYSLGFGVGNGFFGTGLSAMLFVGNPCLQIGLQQHHDALVAEGFDVSTENRDKAHRFYRVSLGCGVASLALGIVATGADSAAPALVSLLIGSVGAGFEIYNFYVHRLNWANDMKAAAGIPTLP